MLSLYAIDNEAMVPSPQTLGWQTAPSHFGVYPRYLLASIFATPFTKSSSCTNNVRWVFFTVKLKYPDMISLFS